MFVTLVRTVGTVVGTYSGTALGNTAEIQLITLLKVSTEGERERESQCQSALTPSFPLTYLSLKYSFSPTARTPTTTTTTKVIFHIPGREIKNFKKNFTFFFISLSVPFVGQIFKCFLSTKRGRERRRASLIHYCQQQKFTSLKAFEPSGQMIDKEWERETAFAGERENGREKYISHHLDCLLLSSFSIPTISQSYMRTLEATERWKWQ